MGVRDMLKISINKILDAYWLLEYIFPTLNTRHQGVREISNYIIQMFLYEY